MNEPINQSINEQDYRAAYKKTSIIQNVTLRHTCDKESIDMLFARRAFASIGYGPWCNNLLHWTNAIIIIRVIMQYLPNIPPITSCKRDQKKTQKNFFSMLQRHYFSRIVCMCVSKLVFKENSNLMYVATVDWQAGVMSSLPICAIFAMLNNALCISVF